METRPILLCKSIFVTIILILAIFVPCLSANDTAQSETSTPSDPITHPLLTINDCHKCHYSITQDINLDGAAHKTQITCLDCHEGHPPRKRGVIPVCSKCHQQEPHFDLPACLKCHINPHTPLKIFINRDITFPCTTCHTTQIEQLKKHPSIHTSLDCTACHTKHGYIPDCFACHGPHTEDMDNADCLSCHQAHMPLLVTYADNTPSHFCGSCHSKAYLLLGKSRAKHRKVSCVSCHESKHKTIPKCQKCHEQIHTPSMIENYSGCGTCHGIAHDLKLNKIDLKFGK